MTADTCPIDIEAAICFAEHSRNTHREWAAYLDGGAPVIKAAGDLDHQKRCILEYDHIIDVLSTVQEKDDQIVALVEAATQPRPNGHKWCALCGMWAQKDQEIDHSRTCVLVNLPAAARERAEEHERLRTVTRRLKTLDDQGKVGAWDPDEPGAGLSEEFADALHELFAALAVEKAE